MRLGSVLLSLVGLASLAGCGGAAATRSATASSKVTPPVGVAAPAASMPAPVPVVAPEPVAFEKGWRGFGTRRCTYLVPKDAYVGADGGIDVVVHFHAGQLAEREMKESGVRGVFVSCAFGIGTGGYTRAFEAPERFGQMMKALTRTLGAANKRNDIHLSHLALVSWSAGFAAVNRILAVPEWYAATDTVVLLDSLHTQYVDGRPHMASQGSDHVDLKTLRRFTRFARDAAEGKKTMVITHSSIVPPSYASTTEATEALLAEVGVAGRVVSEGATNDPGWGLGGGRMTASPTLRADAEGLHVRGFRGNGPHDHFDHLHLIGDTLRSWVVPRWYTPPSERP
jgi:hypothetical protein